MPEDGWRAKANKIIGEMCLAAWRKANIKPNGQRYKKSRPYAVPADAAFLVECLGSHDHERAEHDAKAMFMRLADRAEMGAHDPGE